MTMNIYESDIGVKHHEFSYHQGLKGKSKQPNRIRRQLSTTISQAHSATALHFLISWTVASWNLVIVAWDRTWIHQPKSLKDEWNWWNIAAKMNQFGSIRGFVAWQCLLFFLSLSDIEHQNQQTCKTVRHVWRCALLARKNWLLSLGKWHQTKSRCNSLRGKESGHQSIQNSITVTIQLPINMAKRWKWRLFPKEQEDSVRMNYIDILSQAERH